MPRSMRWATSSGIAEVKGPFAKGSWSGPVEQAAKLLRGWFDLRENSFTPKINRFDTPPETKLFCSAFDAVTEAQASCLTRPAGFQRAGYAKQDDW
jgi:hypothetical protein